MNPSTQEVKSDKKQTPMMELIERLRHKLDYVGPGDALMIKDNIALAESLLPKERQTIEEAAIYGQNEGGDTMDAGFGERYFDSTFENIKP